MSTTTDAQGPPAGPHIAIIRHRANDEIARAVIIPVDLEWANVDGREWLHPYLGNDWQLDTFLPVAFIPDEPGNPKNWPAGAPNEAEIRAKIDHGLEPLVVIIRRADLERLDRIAVFAERMAEFWSDDFSDDLFNLRNGMVPFKDGEAKALGLYDPDDDDGPDFVLSKSERMVLEWLGKEEPSALGECEGADLDRLVELGLAQIARPHESQDPLYGRVALTEAGHAEVTRAAP